MERREFDISPNVVSEGCCRQKALKLLHGHGGFLATGLGKITALTHGFLASVSLGIPQA